MVQAPGQRHGMETKGWESPAPDGNSLESALAFHVVVESLAHIPM